MKLNPPNAHRSQIKMCEKRLTRNVQFRFMQNAFRILKPIQKSSKCVWVFRNTGANAFAKIQMRLAYENKRDLYCIYMYWCLTRTGLYLSMNVILLVWTCCSRIVRCRAILRSKVVGPVHWGPNCSSGQRCRGTSAMPQFEDAGCSSGHRRR